MKFYIATKQHGFLEVDGEALVIDNIECFVHMNDDNTFNVSLSQTGLAFIHKSVDKDTAIKNANDIIPKFIDKFNSHIESSIQSGDVTPLYLREIEPQRREQQTYYHVDVTYSETIKRHGIWAKDIEEARNKAYFKWTNADNREVIEAI